MCSRLLVDFARDRDSDHASHPRPHRAGSDFGWKRIVIDGSPAYVRLNFLVKSFASVATLQIARGNRRGNRARRALGRWVGRHSPDPPVIQEMNAEFDGALESLDVLQLARDRHLQQQFFEWI
jgi:hypothetical protein